MFRYVSDFVSSLGTRRILTYVAIGAGLLLVRYAAKKILASQENKKVTDVVREIEASEKA